MRSDTPLVYRRGRGLATGPAPGSSLLHVAAGEDARDVAQDVVGRRLVVPVVLDEAPLDDLDLVLRVLVDDVGHEARELDRVLLILEELHLERASQAIVGVVVELLALDRERADVVHDLPAEVILAAVRDVDLLLDGAHEPLVRLLVAAGVAVLDL